MVFDGPLRCQFLEAFAPGLDNVFGGSSAFLRGFAGFDACGESGELPQEQDARGLDLAPRFQTDEIDARG